MNKLTFYKVEYKNRMDVQLDNCPPTLLRTIILQRVIML